MNHQTLHKVVSIMEDEAGKRNAVVFQVEKILGSDPYKNLVFTMLSARTRDEKTLLALDRILKRAKTFEELMHLDETEIEKLLYGVGFYRVKSKNLKKLAEIIVEKFSSIVPNSLEELTSLPGVGRKTANIVLARVHSLPAIGVDTHVHRISNRLGLVKTKKPEETEQELNKIVPDKEKWRFNTILVAYGQTICSPLIPSCSICKLKDTYCKRIGVENSK
ncbi:MAG: endonuclease III [Candidatus Micrarchaeota archaeon]